MFVYILKSDHVVLDSQSVCASLGKTILLLSASFSAMIAYILRSHGLSPAQFGMSIAIAFVQLMIRQSCW